MLLLLSLDSRDVQLAMLLLQIAHLVVHQVTLAEELRSQSPLHLFLLDLALQELLRGFRTVNLHLTKCRS